MNMIGLKRSADQLATTNQIAAGHKKLSHWRTNAWLWGTDQANLSYGQQFDNRSMFIERQRSLTNPARVESFVTKRVKLGRHGNELAYQDLVFPHAGFLDIWVSWACSSGVTLCIEMVLRRVQPRNRTGIGTALFRNSVASLRGTSTRSAIIPVRNTSSRWTNGCWSASGSIRSTADLDTR